MKYGWLVSLALVLNACSIDSEYAVKLVGQQEPYAKFVLLDGDSVVLDEYRGKSVVVLFWATWCTHSRPVINELNEIAQKYRDRNDVVFLAASVDKADDLGKLQDRIRYQKLDGFVHAFSGNEGLDEAYIAMGSGPLPQVFVVDPSGKIVAQGHDVDIVQEYLHS